jgi:hypothetical protein
MKSKMREKIFEVLSKNKNIKLNIKFKSKKFLFLFFFIKIVKNFFLDDVEMNHLEKKKRSLIF